MRHGDSEKINEPSIPGTFEPPSRCYYTNLLSHLPALTDCADHPVSSGVFNIWSRLLGCPSWITQGTSLEDDAPLPRFIRQKDDLIILANFLDNLGPKPIISSILDNRSVPSNARTYSRIMSCPNGINLIDYIKFYLNIQHKFSNISVKIIKKYVYIDIHLNINLGVVGHFYQMLMALSFCRFISSLKYGDMLQYRDCELIYELGSKQLPWLDYIAESAEFPVSQTNNCNRVSVSLDWMTAPNSRYDALLWGEALGGLSEYANHDGVSVSLLRIKELVRCALINEHRPPRLKEIADLEGISGRTFARRIALLGTCYQDIVDTVRADLAKEQLLDGNNTVDEVANRLGFSHSSSFARAFASWQGLSPTKWREIQTTSNKSRTRQ